jgi:urea transport system substrate-binding protein
VKTTVRGRSTRTTIALLAAVSIVAAACGGGDEPAAQPTDEEPANSEEPAPSDDEPAPSDEEPADGEPIRIGVIADLTGPFTTYGTSLSRSAQVAVDEINAAGGIAGQTVELIVEDIQTDVAVTVDKARKLVEQDQVDVILGPIGSDANDAAFQTVVTEGQTMLIYPETYEGGKCDPLFFSTGAVPAQQIRPLIERLSDEYGPKALLFGADYVWPRRSFEIAKPIIDEAGGEVVAEVYLPLVADDYSELITAVRDSDPDYIFSLYPAVWGAALKAMDDAGLLTDDLGLGTTFLGDPDLAGIGPLARNNYTALPFFTSAEGPGVAGFLEAYAATFGEGEIPSGGESMGAYNAVYLYKQAVEAAGTTEPSAVAEAMVGQTFDGPTGPVTMAESHHLEQTIQLVKVNDEGVHEFVEAFSARDPEEACQP